jgi:hypothetical protein
MWFASRGGVAQDLVIRVQNIARFVPGPTALERFYITRLLFLVSSCARLEEFVGALQEVTSLSQSSQAQARASTDSPEV